MIYFMHRFKMKFVPHVLLYVYPKNIHVIPLSSILYLKLMILLTTPIYFRVFKYLHSLASFIELLVGKHFFIRVYHDIFKFSPSFHAFMPKTSIGVVVYSRMHHNCTHSGKVCSNYLFYHVIFLWSDWWDKLETNFFGSFCTIFFKIIVFACVVIDNHFGGFLHTLRFIQDISEFFSQLFLCIHEEIPFLPDYNSWSKIQLL